MLNFKTNNNNTTGRLEDLSPGNTQQYSLS